MCFGCCTCVQRRRYLQETNYFFKINSALICSVFISTYLCFFLGLGLLAQYFFILLFLTILFLFCLLSALFHYISAVCVFCVSVLAL